MYPPGRNLTPELVSAAGLVSAAERVRHKERAHVDSSKKCMASMKLNR